MHMHHHHDNKIKERKAQFVVIIGFIAMSVEISYGYATNSMALLMDGWHMASHVAVLGFAWFAYIYVRKNKDNPRFKQGPEKILSLSGFSGAVLLIAVALVMLVESIQRLLTPEAIAFKEALVIACAGLVVNGTSALILQHKHTSDDHNIQAAYLHVLADVLTSILAIAALGAGILWNIRWLDACSGIIASVVIVRWSYSLLIRSGRELVDYHQD